MDGFFRLAVNPIRFLPPSTQHYARYHDLAKYAVSRNIVDSRLLECGKDYR